MSLEPIKIELPEGLDPVKYLIEDKERFSHELCQHAVIANPNLSEEYTWRTIALAAGSVSNQNLFYRSFLPHMPDTRSRELLESLLWETELLVASTFGRTDEELNSLSTQRERYQRVVDRILLAYSSLATYLEEELQE